MELPGAKWQIVEAKSLNLIGTQITIYYHLGLEPYHVHRALACHGSFDTLDDAKAHCFVVVREMMEMGVDP